MQKVKQNVKRFLNFNGEPPGYRTRDTLIKSYRGMDLASVGVQKT